MSSDCGCGCGGRPGPRSCLGPAPRRRVHVHVYDFLPPAPGPSEATLVSSQWFLNPYTVQDKLEANDFEVLVSKLFHVDGQPYRVIMDGHHSYQASLLARAPPTLIQAEDWHGINRLIDVGDILGALQHQFQRMGPYYLAASRKQQLAWPRGSPYFMEA